MGEAGDKIMSGLDEALQHSKRHREDLALIQSLKVLAEQALEKGFAGWSEIAKRAKARLEAASNASDTLLCGLSIGDWVSHPSRDDQLQLVGFEIDPQRALACVTTLKDGDLASSWWHLPIAELTRVDRPKVHHLQVGGDVRFHGPWAESKPVDAPLDGC